MRIDLHTHSSCSDGTDAPPALVAAASDARLDVLALTDHDTFAGWDDALSAAVRLGVGLVRGAEVSCRLGPASVHMLAYLPDPGDAALQEMLERIRAGRDERVPHMVERLRDLGVDLTVEAVAAQARAAMSLGRPHVADALVAAGYAADRREAFDRWLGEGRPAYVTRYAPSPTEVIERIVFAGGVPVLAHPRGRASAPVLTDAVVADLAAAGLAGIEVDHRDHDDVVRRDLRTLAAALDLVVTGSSDYHGTGKDAHDLGCWTTDEVEFARLLDRARTNASRSGRTCPEAYLP
ncbi:MAG TPA: PHP domain-containing protein [Actinopolymorphaceae bacterium]|nr:PHP domain-containing protein [Actinopolymorphaceae bacterium]